MLLNFARRCNECSGLWKCVLCRRSCCCRPRMLQFCLGGMIDKVRILLNVLFIAFLIYVMVIAFVKDETDIGVAALFLTILHLAIFLLPLRAPAILMFFILIIPFIILITVNFFVWIFCLCRKSEYVLDDDEAAVGDEIPIEYWGEQPRVERQSDLENLEVP